MALPDETHTLIEIPQAAYNVGEDALVDNADRTGIVGCDPAAVVADVLHAAGPVIVAAAYEDLADQLTELADRMRQEPICSYTKAAGLVEGIIVIRERAAQLRGSDV